MWYMHQLDATNTCSPCNSYSVYLVYQVNTLGSLVYMFVNGLLAVTDQYIYISWIIMDWDKENIWIFGKSYQKNSVQHTEWQSNYS